MNQSEITSKLSQAQPNAYMQISVNSSINQTFSGNLKTMNERYIILNIENTNKTIAIPLSLIKSVIMGN